MGLAAWGTLSVYQPDAGLTTCALTMRLPVWPSSIEISAWTVLPSSSVTVILDGSSVSAPPITTCCELTSMVSYSQKCSEAELCALTCAV